MPRHRRQRPTWLPSWIPYKDGRYLGLARQTILAWSSTILATVFFVMTVAYATRASKFSRVKFIYASQSSTILVLRLLSEAAAIFLARSVYSTFEIVQWVLISRPEGIQFPLYLALQPGTGPLGLLVIALGQGLSKSQWPMKPRLTSLLRMLAQAVIPMTGVLIMSHVNTHPVYTAQYDKMMATNFGMRPFNSSLASQLGVWQDVMFNMGYVAFLSNPLHAIDITPDSEKKKQSCALGVGLANNSSCTRQILITQEYNQVQASIPIQGDLDTQVILSVNQRIYSLEYHDNVEFSTENIRCEQLTSGPASYLLCTQNAKDGSIEAKMIACPPELVVKNRCSNDTSWKTSQGFTTSLQPSFLNASVAYDRTDGRILSHELLSEPKAAMVNASELLDAMVIILNTTLISSQNSQSNPILGSPNHFFGRLVAAHNYRITRMMETSPDAMAKGSNALQSILALTLFYCQDGIMGESVLPTLSNSSATVKQYSTGIFSKRTDDTYVALANTQYRIEVGRITLLIYIALSGVTLLICFIVLIIGSLLELVQFDAETTLWPALDFYTQCKVQDRNGKVVTPHRRVEMAWIHDGKQLFHEIEGLKVTRRKRGHGPRPAPDPGVEPMQINDG